LHHSYRPCHPGSLVAAMRLGKTFVTANLPNISDYAFDNSNAILYEAENPESLASAIQSLWSNLIKCEILGGNGQEFATTFCSRASIRRCFSQLLTRRGL